eukprot:GFUD01067185.1.p1 GENE.GFUD01067185.1~~GFUD01067185.1.p1  ORF type:complete len:381 (-),score=124.12 GFUD01067185.1:121-1263(-)
MMQPAVPGWVNPFKRNMKNMKKDARILLFSPQAEVDKNYVDQLRKDPDNNQITFHVLNMVEENICSLEGIVKESDQDKLMERVKKTDPTLILLAYNHGVQFGSMPQFPMTEFCEEPPLNSVPWLLKQKGMVGEILKSSKTLLTISTTPAISTTLTQDDYEPKNIWKLESCLLSCTVTATGNGLIRELEEVLKENKIENKEDTRVMILSGGHGDNKDEKNNMTAVEGVSWFKQLYMLEYKFYEYDCKRIGVAAEPDPCIYHPTEKTVADIKQNVSQSKPEPMAPYAWPSPDKTPLMKDERYNKMKFNVLNVGQFYRDPDGLVEYLMQYNPTLIITPDYSVPWLLKQKGMIGEILKSSKTLLTLSTEGIKVAMLTGDNPNKK